METGVIRLIDANALKRDLIDNWAFYSVLLKNAIERQPTIDAVEVVRCKDCKFYEIHKPSVLENCERNSRMIPMMPDDFCSYGERRADNDRP